MQAQNASGTIDANFNLVWRTVDRLLDGFRALLPLLLVALVVFVLLLFAAKGVRYLWLLASAMIFLLGARFNTELSGAAPD